MNKILKAEIRAEKIMGNKNTKKVSINSQKTDSEEASKKIFTAIENELRSSNARSHNRKKTNFRL